MCFGPRVHSRRRKSRRKRMKTDRNSVQHSLLVLFFVLVICTAATAQETKTMIVRISEIEIEDAYLGEYKAILREESAASVKMEPGVISIFPMFEKEAPTHIRILEIYD